MAPQVAGASGLQIRENSGTAQGNSFAGASAAALDVSYMYQNPAGITRLRGEHFSAAATAIIGHADFDSSGSTTTVLGGTISGSDGGDDVGTDALVPALHYARQVNDRLFLGASLTAPFGLGTDYDEDWVGRYHALESKVMTLNFNPVVAYRTSDRLSLAGGVQIAYTRAYLSNAVDFGTLDALPVGSGGFGGAFGGTPTADDGTAEVEGTDYSFGFNLGLLYEFSPGTRVGATYRSMLRNNLEGDANFNNSAVGNAIASSQNLFVNTTATAAVVLPESASAGFYHEVSPKLALMGEVAWTAWSRVKELRVKFGNSSQPDSVIVTRWRDSWFFALGANYRLDKHWMLRAGVAYDQTPVPDDTRSPRVPDEDRKWISVGASYRFSDSESLDFGYTRLIFDDASLQLRTSESSNALRGNLSGSYDISVDVFALQYRLAF